MDFSVTISDMDMTILADELIDVDYWIQSAVSSKIQSVKTKMIKEWHDKLFADPTVENIPANEDSLINMIVVRDDYNTEAQIQEERIANW